MSVPLIPRRELNFQLHDWLGVDALLQAPRFAPEVIERERARRSAALKDALTRPDTLAARAFWAALYPEHPYGRQTTPDGLNALTRADVQAF